MVNLLELENVLHKIKPSKQEEEVANSTINELMLKIQKSIRNLDIDAEVFLGGSFGKGTWLKGQSDVDLFVRFSKKYEDCKLSDLLENILKLSNLGYIRVRGSRDYFKVIYKNLEFEIVPIYRISSPEEAKNVTDLSPFHVSWIKSKIKENRELADEIRLAKAFFKANNLYGAESYIRGFSGYAIEILTIYYGSFIELIRAAVHWRPKVFIDVEKYYKNFEEARKKMNPDRLKSPIIVIDPTDPKRNATASVSMKKFSELILCSKLFLEDLSSKKDIKNWFEKKKIDLGDEIKKVKDNNLILLYFEVKGRGESLDIANTKVLKFKDLIEKQLKILGFTIFNTKLSFANNLGDSSKIFMWIYPRTLPRLELRYGPPVWKEPNISKFLEKWKKCEIFISSDGRVMALTERKIKTIEEAVNFILDKFKKNIEEKVKIVKIGIYE